MFVLAGAGPASAQNDGNENGNDECVDFVLMGVRGSGELSSDGRGHGKRVVEIWDALVETNPDWSYREEPIQYTAAGATNPLNYISNLFFTSADEGVGRVDLEITRGRIQCPDQQYILAGYSQGAMVLNSWLHDEDDLSDIAGVVLLADPSRRGEAPYVRTRAGGDGITVLNLFVPGQYDQGTLPTELHSKTFDYCAPRDPVCTGFVNGLFVNRHTDSTYYIDRYPPKAAVRVARELYAIDSSALRDELTVGAQPGSRLGNLGTRGVTFEVATGALPPGVQLQQNGRFRGRVLSTETELWPVTINMIDSNGQIRRTLNHTFRVVERAILVGPDFDGNPFTPWSFNFEVTSGVRTDFSPEERYRVISLGLAPETGWTLSVDGELPHGLTISPAGRIRGTVPWLSTQPVTFDVELRVEWANNPGRTIVGEAEITVLPNVTHQFDVPSDLGQGVATHLVSMNPVNAPWAFVGYSGDPGSDVVLLSTDGVQLNLTGESNGRSYFPVGCGPDGIAFASSSTDLVPDSASRTDGLNIFFWSPETGFEMLSDEIPDEWDSVGDLHGISCSANGRKIAFVATKELLLPGGPGELDGPLDDENLSSAWLFNRARQDLQRLDADDDQVEPTGISSTVGVRCPAGEDSPATRRALCLQLPNRYRGDDCRPARNGRQPDSHTTR